jgi:type VI secretion system secreted protein Hcp
LKEKDMAVDVFMKIDGISGESVDTQYKEWIEVLSLNWEVDTSTTERGHGGPRSSHFGIIKVVDKATPQILRATTQNELIKEIRIALCRAGKEKLKYLEYVFKNCVITKAQLQMGTHSGETLPTENLQFRFASITVTYFQQKRDTGGSAGHIEAYWDVSSRG